MPDIYRKRIVELIKSNRPEAVKPDGEIDMRRISTALGRNHAYMQQFIKRETPRVLPEDVRRALANYLGVNESALRPEKDTLPPDNTPLKGVDGSPQLRRFDTPPFGARDLPVYGSTIGGEDSDFSMNGTAHEYIARPEHLRAVQNAYAVYIHGDSMEPVAYRGQIAYVNPNKPPTPHCLVVVELADGRGLIKQFIRKTASKWLLRQFNPPRDLEFEAGQVKAIHRIVLHGDAS